jgi:nitrogen fixation NifU-like protein
MSYNEKVMQYFKEPKNYGKMENPDGVGKVGNPMCGDIMWLYIKVGRNEEDKNTIEDIKFETFGCVAAIATSSMITEMAKGKTIEEAMKIEKNDIVESLDGLPPAKVHCSVLASGALAEAIYDYLSKNNLEIPEKLEKEHKRLEKEKQQIMEKYKDWVEAEEKNRG